MTDPRSLGPSPDDRPDPTDVAFADLTGYLNSASLLSNQLHHDLSAETQRHTIEQLRGELDLCLCTWDHIKELIS